MAAVLNRLDLHYNKYWLNGHYEKQMHANKKIVYNGFFDEKYYEIL